MDSLLHGCAEPLEMGDGSSTADHQGGAQGKLLGHGADAAGEGCCRSLNDLLRARAVLGCGFHHQWSQGCKVSRAEVLLHHPGFHCGVAVAAHLIPDLQAQRMVG